MSGRWEQIATAVLVACALTTTALVVRHELGASDSAASTEPARPVFHEQWRDLLQYGARLGPRDAKVEIIEFADFECPFCEKMHVTLSQLRGRFGSDVAVTFIHYPLAQHRFAELAARAAECADKQGRFEAMHDTLFTHQRALGIKPWSELANQSGVSDPAAFDTCMKDPAPLWRIEHGKRLADELSIFGTPTLIINGWQITVPPTLDRLESMVKLAIAGESPVAEKAPTS